MTAGRLPALIVFVLAGVALAAALLWIGGAGFHAGEGAALAGQAMLGASDRIAISELITAYPPLPQVPMIAADEVLGGTGLATTILSALLGGGLVASWFVALRRSGLARRAVLPVTLLLAINPLFLRAVAEGPQALLLLWASWWVARSLFGLRATTTVNDLILFSVALAIMPFLSLHGAVMAVASLPFLLLAVPKPLMQRAFGSTYLLLLFPFLFALFSFGLVCWIFLDDPLGFLPADTAWPRFAGWRAAAIGAVGAVAAMPIMIGLALIARTRWPILAVAILLLFALMLAAAAMLTLRPDFPLAIALAPAASLAAAPAVAWRAGWRRGTPISLLLLVGIVTGAVILRYDASREGRAFAAAIEGEASSNTRDGDARLGLFLRGKSDITIDAAAHPAVVSWRGSADGLVTASTEPFKLMALRQRPQGRFLVIRRPDPAERADALGLIFPDLYGSGADQYRLIYDADGWRVWQRGA